MPNPNEIKSPLSLSGPAPNRTNEVPPVIPDHEMVRRIGSGSYGDVWLARSAVGTWRAAKVVYRNHFKDERPYEREFSGIQKYEPISRTNEGLVDVLQIGRNDADGYFYYVMELADSAQPSSQSADLQKLTSAQAGSNQGLQTAADAFVPKTLASEIRSCGRLPVDECITLGITLNLALGHLHRTGLIHRDVKPSNIIFVNGVAKLADIGLVTDLAAAQSFVGTEGFIPPEGPNSPQADIFALGKVLYEASMGKDRQEFPEPRSDLGLDAESKALMELNAVLLRACAPDPRQRYQTTQEMNADLALLNSGKSVQDKHALERRLKITRRVAVVTVAVMVLGVVPYYLAIKESKRARAAAESAGIEAAKSEQVAGLLKDMLRSVGPSIAKGRDTALLKEILDQTAADLSNSLTNQPEVEAELRVVLGQVYLEIGQIDTAVAMQEQALRLRRSVFGEANYQVARSLDHLAEACLKQGKAERAEVLLRQSLDVLHRVLNPSDPELATAKNNLAILLHHKGRLAEAETMHREALAVQQRAFGGDHREIATSLANLAVVLHDQGKLEEAETGFREALEMRKRLEGEENLAFVNALNSLSMALRSRNKLDEAETANRDALAILKKLVGEEHPEVAQSLHNLANIQEAQGKIAEATTNFRASLAMRHKFMSPDHPDVLMASMGLAIMLYRQGSAEEAEILLRDALAIEKQTLGDEHPLVARTCSSLAVVLHKLGQLQEAETLAREGWLLGLRVRPPEHPDILAAAMTLSLILKSQGRFAELETIQQDHLERLRPRMERQDPRLAEPLTGLTITLMAESKHAEAEPLVRECLAIREKHQSDNWRTFNTRSQLGECLLALKKYSDAEPLLLAGFEGMKQRAGTIPAAGRSSLREAPKQIVRFYEETNRPDRAAQWNGVLAELTRAEAEPKPDSP